MDWKIKRRDFLKFVGFTAAGLTLGELLKDKILPKEVFKEGWGEGPGIESFRLSICGQCGAGCSVKIRLVDANAKKVNGNPLCPVARGKLCPKGEASLQTLYDPDRWLGPAKRVGPGTDLSGWQKITWEQALKELLERLNALRTKGKPEKLLWIMDEDHSSYGLLVQRFMKAYGSANLVTLTNQRDPASREVLKACQGIDDDPAYDFERCNFILSFGTPLLEHWLSPVWIHRMYGDFRQGRSQGRGRFIQIEPRLSPTAAKADEWIAIRPGREGHLALGLAYVLIREERYDQDFIKEHCEGFEEWRNFVLSNYEPDVVSQLTEVPVTKILQLAREFSSTRPSLAIAERTTLSNSFFTLWAVHCLNALMGNIDRPGGLLIQRRPPLKNLPEVKLDKAAQEGLSHERLDGLDSSGSQRSSLAPIAERILNDPENAPEILIFSSARSLAASPDSKTFVEAAGKIPFIVTFSPFWDDTAHLANLVLPDHTFLEKWQDDITPSWNGTPRYAVSEPALSPMLNTRNKADSLLQIVQGLGGIVRENLPWKSFPELLKELAQGLYESRRGTFFTTPYESSWIRQMEKGGWWASQAKDFDEFWEKLIKKGGWHDPVYTFEQWRRVLKTSSHKFEFLGAPSQLRRAPIDPSEKINTRDYPFYLYPFEVLVLGGVENSNQPFLQEILSTLVDGAWKSWIEINPQTAKKLGIQDGDWVWVESPKGKAKRIARIYPGTAPDCISLLLGNDHILGGRWVHRRERGAQDLLIYQSDLGKAYPLLYSTRANVRKV